MKEILKIILKMPKEKLGNRWFMRHIFKTLVIPHIHYCSQHWRPVDGDGTCSLEKLQHDFFKKDTRINRNELLGMSETYEYDIYAKKTRFIQSNICMEDTRKGSPKLWHQPSARI